VVATLEGLNRMMNTMSTPEYGAHVYYPALAEYVPAAGACPEVNSEVLIPMNVVAPGSGSGVMSMPGCVEVPRGVGRSLFSRYDSSGYDVFRRVVESGHFYDQMAAMVALQASNASVVGIGQDVNADARTFRIPYNLVFSTEVEGLFSSIYNEKDTGYAMHIQQLNGRGEVLQRTVFDGMTDAEVAQLPVLQPGRTYTTRVQALVAGMNLLDGSLNAEFAKRGQISLVGSGEQRTAPPGFTAVEVASPTTGRMFVAYKKDGDLPGIWYAAEQIEKTKALIEREAPAADVENAFGDIELIRMAFGIFGQ
jgi:hypothetical protein